MPRLLQLPWRLLKALLTWIVALLILFEEWVWEPLAHLLARLGRLPVIGWLERRIAALPPRLALVVFFIPALMLLPVKLLALWLIGQGRTILGVVVIVLAKVVGTAVVARLFMLTQPQLMTMPWFARLHARWVAWKGTVMAQVRASAPWRAARAISARARAWWAKADR